MRQNSSILASAISVVFLIDVPVAFVDKRSALTLTLFPLNVSVSQPGKAQSILVTLRQTEQAQRLISAAKSLRHPTNPVTRSWMYTNRNLTRAKAKAACQLSPPTTCFWEHGNTHPSDIDVASLCQFCAIPNIMNRHFYRLHYLVIRHFNFSTIVLNYEVNKLLLYNFVSFKFLFTCY